MPSGVHDVFFMSVHSSAVKTVLKKSEGNLYTPAGAIRESEQERGTMLSQ